MRVGAVIGDLLPLAVGVAISPIPIIAVILMLLSRQASRTSAGFLLGWVAGMVVVTVIVLVLTGQAQTSPTEPSTVSSALKLVFGVAMILLAARNWRRRPRHGEEQEMPGWMSAIDAFTFGKASGLGFLLSGVNPKNLMMCLGAGAVIGGGGLSVAGTVVAVAVFTVIAASSVAAPVVVYLSARERMAGPLKSLHHWLAGNNATVMAVVLLVIGVALLGRGIGGLTT